MNECTPGGHKGKHKSMRCYVVMISILSGAMYAYIIFGLSCEKVSRIQLLVRFIVLYSRDATVLCKILNRSVCSARNNTTLWTAGFRFCNSFCIDASQATVCVCVCVRVCVQAGEKPSPRVNVQSLLCLHTLTPSHIVTGARLGPNRDPKTEARTVA